MAISFHRRRAVGLLAASTLGMTSAVLGVTGVAQAVSVPVANDVTLTVPANTCAIDWILVGGAGGTGGIGVGGKGDRLTFTTVVQAGDEFLMQTGSAAVNAAGGLSGTISSGGTGAVDGGGGGGASVVASTTDSDLFVIAAGGGGGGKNTDGGAAGFAGGDYEDVPNATFYYGGLPGNSPDEVGVDSVGPGAGAGGGGLNGGDSGETDGAFGGAGGGGDSAVGVSAAATNVIGPVTSLTGGNGSIDYTLVTCPAPSAPSLDSIEPGNGSATVTFTPGDPTGSSAVTGWQVSTDDGGTWNALSTTGTGPITGTVSGLTNGTTYDVKVRATSASGTGAASNAVAVTPYAPLPAPAGVAAAVGVSSIEVSWQAVGGAAGYEAWALPGADPQSSQGLVTCETTTGLSCLLGVAPGGVYSVYVRALDAHLGAASTHIVTGVVPGAEVPTSVPTGSAPLITNDSTLTVGQQVTLTGSGYLPGSTVTVIMYSTPTVLGTIVVDGAGNFTYTVTIPAGLEAGTHSLVASGVDPSGATRFLRVDVTVTSAGTVSGLAFTGFSILGPLLAGLGALGAGTGLLVASRRRPVAILA